MMGDPDHIRIDLEIPIDTNVDGFALTGVDLEIVTDYDLKTKELEQAVMWAELRLANCSWSTGESNRAKVKAAKSNLAKHKAAHNDL